MSSPKAINFFATRSDLEQVAADVEPHKQLVYFRSGLFEEPIIISYSSMLDLPDLGTAAIGDPNQLPWYLVSELGAELTPQAIPQRRGGIRYAIDQRSNPQSIAFRAGGVVDERILIPGQVGSCTQDVVSAEILSLFFNAIRQTFCKIKSYYVGGHAANILDAGGRLAPNLKAGREYDLKR